MFDFVGGLSYWMVVVVVISLMIMLLLGMGQYREFETNEGLKIKRIFNDKMYRFATTIFTTIFGVLCALKIVDGEVFLMKTMIYLFAIFIYAIVVFWTGKVVGLAKLGALVEEQQQMSIFVRDENYLDEYNDYYYSEAYKD